MTNFDRATLMTAEQFWTNELAGPMSLLMDPEKAFKEETQEAQRVARQMGIEVTGDALPWSVWDALYTDPKDE